MREAAPLSNALQRHQLPARFPNPLTYRLSSTGSGILSFGLVHVDVIALTNNTAWRFQVARLCRKAAVPQCVRCQKLQAPSQGGPVWRSTQRGSGDKSARPSGVAALMIAKWQDAVSPDFAASAAFPSKKPAMAAHILLRMVMQSISSARLSRPILHLHPSRTGAPQRICPASTASIPESDSTP